MKLIQKLLCFGVFLALVPGPTYSATLSKRTVGLKNFREILASFEDATGVSAKNPDIQAIYRKVASRLPVTGEVEELGSPTIMALVELGGSFCNTLVQRELSLSPSDRKFFLFVDAGKGVEQFTDPLWRSTVTEIAMAFWQREPSVEEVASTKLILDAVLKESSTDPGKTPQLLQTVCTQAAGSLAFLTNGI